ncbi:RteC domain-containing protein [Chitinophaga sedimenti]|uniref:RteC domain-containing protein n=1 Tax=Chitinophaga sedimenti TaxID=2033606 RepID=UPI00249EDF50|nr:RteC domain-containing protein [Chitinophaga sedimenti]
MLDDLDQIAIDPDQDLASVRRCIGLMADATEKMETFLSDYAFLSEEEQIHFFKYLKPQLDGRRIYYTQLLRIFNRGPVWNDGQKVAHLKAQLQQIDGYYQRNSELYLYHRLGESYNDRLYFLRGLDDLIPDIDYYPVFLDKRYHTRKSFQYGVFFANEMLTRFLHRQLGADTGITPMALPGPGQKQH